MKTHHTILAAAAALLLLPSPSHAGLIRWMGVDMNTNADSPFSALQHVDTTEAGTGPSYSAPIGSLGGTFWGPGANGMNLTGSATANSGLSLATTTWNINGVTDTLNMTMNHSIAGAISPGNFAGSEGVFYFYALTAGTISVTYDYGFEQTDPTTDPYKASERGRSKQYVYRNSKGLGGGGSGGTEIVNRDGSRTFTEYVTPGDDLIALAFDFQILEDPQQTTISGGYSTMTFTPTPVPEPGTALVGAVCGIVGLLSRRRVRG